MPLPSHHARAQPDTEDTLATEKQSYAVVMMKPLRSMRRLYGGNVRPSSERKGDKRTTENSARIVSHHTEVPMQVKEYPRL